ncbi:MAG: methyltransferase domain-containing protein [Gammaproteobacteria bacterium]
MRSLIRHTALIACSFVLAGSAIAVAPDFMDKLTADSRPMEDRMRDGARRPYQVMQLLGVEAGMTAVDIGAGGGWYTRVLSAAVGPSGHVIAQFGPRALERNNGQGPRDLAASLGNTEVSFENLGDLDANIADVAVTALNVHHGNDARNIPTFRAVLRVLKPGGRAAIIDHVGLANIDNSQLHRIPPAQVRAQIEAAGLEIVEESDILRSTADDHTMAVNDPALGRNSDRFLFIVRKPQ